MNKYNLASIFLLLAASPCLASDFYLADQALPESVQTLKGTDSLPENPHAYDTPLGVTSRCYQGEYFLVLSSNALGSGYEFTRQAPQDATCVAVTSAWMPIVTDAEVSLGLSKSEVLQKIRAPEVSDQATLLYNKEKLVDGVKRDEQTWVDVEFTNNVLSRLSVFTSLTQ